MKSIDKIFGKEVKDQAHYTRYCSNLFKRPPERMDIIAADNSDSCIIFDGECWREFKIDRTET